MRQLKKLNYGLKMLDTSEGKMCDLNCERLCGKGRQWSMKSEDFEQNK